MEKSFEEIFEEILKDDTKESTNIWKEKLLHTEKPIVLFGAGSLGNSMAGRLYLWGVKPTCFCDNFKTGIDREYQLPIISFDCLKENHKDSYIIISLGMENVNSVMGQLLDAGFHEENIVSRIWMEEKLSKDYVVEHYQDYKWVYDNLEDDISKEILVEKIQYCLYYYEIQNKYKQYSDMYFDEDIIILSDHEVYIDGGAYTGDTVMEFMNRTDNNYKEIYLFEPDKKNYKKLIENCNKIDRINIINKGLWSRENELKFSSNIGANCSVKELGNISISVTSLDSILIKTEAQPTFIKYDIEGSEYEALMGARNVIANYKPRLAICVYHKPEDLYEIPKLIKDLNPLYKLFLRHYSNANVDTVCYAI